MLEEDVILSKISIVKKCLATIRMISEGKPDALNDVIAQDASVLNLQRAIQACIDMSNLLISQRGWKLPATYKEGFRILRDHGVIDQETEAVMAGMVGFRNIAIHDYRQLDADVLSSIVSTRLGDFEKYYEQVYRFTRKSGGGEVAMEKSF